MNITSQALDKVFFDTHAAIKKLQKAGVPEKQAEAQVELLSRFAEKELVTKGHFDLKMKDSDLKMESLKVEIHKIKNELLKWVVALMLAQTGLIIALLKFIR